MKKNDIGVDTRSNGGHIRILLTGFKSFRLGHPNFEIKLTDFFATNVSKTAFIAQMYLIIIFIIYLQLIRPRTVCFLTI